MEKSANFEESFHHHLREIYSAETQILKILPEMIENANSKMLKKAFSDHLEETYNQIRRLEEISKEHYLILKGETCEAMQALIREAKSFISKNKNDQNHDFLMIADAQRIEHYEISAYGRVLKYAKALGQNEVVEKLEKSLVEEYNTEQTLNKLATENTNLNSKLAG